MPPAPIITVLDINGSLRDSANGAARVEVVSQRWKPHVFASARLGGGSSQMPEVVGKALGESIEVASTVGRNVCGQWLVSDCKWWLCRKCEGETTG